MSQAAHRRLAALLWIAMCGTVHAQPVAESGEQRRTIALISVLGPQVQVVERRAPGSVWFSYRRQALPNVGEALDTAVLRGLESAVASVAPSTPTARLALAMLPSALWRWRGSPHSPLPNALDQIAPIPTRAEWNEILLVVPLLIEHSVGVPPLRRGAGIFADIPRGPEVSSNAVDERGKVSVHVNARVWRISAKSLTPIGSEDIVTSTPLVEENPDGARVGYQPDEAAFRRLGDLAESSVRSAAMHLLQSDDGAQPFRGSSSSPTSTAQRSARTGKAVAGQALPAVEVTGRRAACPALQWTWYDALAVAYEQRIYGSSVVIPTRFDEAMRKAREISREALSLGCLVPITADCAEDTSSGDRVRADSGDSWRERDVPEELLARGVDAAFLREKLPYFSRPERCRP